MATEVRMPKLGLTMTEGTILEWKKKEGDQVKKGEPLFSVETDKLTNEVEAETDGTLLRILVAEGEAAECKATVAYIGETEENIDSFVLSGSPAHHQNEQVLLEDPVVLDSNDSKMDGQDRYVTATPFAKKIAREKTVDLKDIPVKETGRFIHSKDIATFLSGSKAKFSPVAAKMAQDMGIDVSTIGSNGRIMKADILAMADRDPNEACDQTECGLAGAKEEERPEKVSALRRSIAANMIASWSTSPCVTFVRPVDASNMKMLRTLLKDELAQKGVKLTYNHILMLCTSRALIEFPDINASFKDNMITRHKHVNLGLAVAKGDGLIVPNLKQCEALSLLEIAKGTEAMIEAARTGKLTMDGMTGGTFTISNLGTYGITSFSPIINQPELAILGVCDIVDTPVIRNGEVVIRPMMNLCLTADHRVVDGVMASRFLLRIVELLENPCRLLL